MTGKAADLLDLGCNMRRLILSVVFPFVAFGYNNPPYEVYPYVAEDADIPPL